MERDLEDYKIFINGDNSGFENIVIRYRYNLIYFINRYVKNVHISEEIAQDVFVEIYTNKYRYNMEGNFKTFLFTIGRNKAIDYIRKNNRISFIDDIEKLKDIADMDYLENTIFKKEDSIIVRRTLSTLPLSYQEVINLVDFEELSHAQAAKVMDKNVTSIKVLIHRARKKLRKQLEREGFEYVK